MRGITAAVLLTFILLPSAAGAVAAPTCSLYCQSLGTETPLESPEGRTCVCNPLTTSRFTGVLDQLLEFLLNAAIVAAPLLFLAAGLLFLTGGSNPEQLNRAKAILVWTAAGFILILVARGLVSVIRTLVGI